MICGVDPGLATGAMVLLDLEGDVTAAQRLGKAKGSAKAVKDRDPHADPQFTDAVDRALQVAAVIVRTVEAWKPTMVAMESFTDQASRAKKKTASGKAHFDRNRWMTPLVIGTALPRLADLGYSVELGTLRMQNPAILSQFDVELAILEGKADGTKPGGAELLTSDHHRKAWCHAEYARIRHRSGETS